MLLPLHVLLVLPLAMHVLAAVPPLLHLLPVLWLCLLCIVLAIVKKAFLHQRRSLQMCWDAFANPSIARPVFALPPSPFHRYCYFRS